MLGFVIVCALLAAVLLLLFLVWGRYDRLLREHDHSLHEARKQSVNQSRSTLKGQISEQMAPLLPGFTYLPADSRFLGHPIDYLVFNGYTALMDSAGDRDESGEGLEIVLLELKRGRSQLSPMQRALGRAVEAGRVRFEVRRIMDDGTVTADTWAPARPNQ
jgi:predicted Holliday junction resolvase-like endonuclease